MWVPKVRQTFYLSQAWKQTFLSLAQFASVPGSEVFNVFFMFSPFAKNMILKQTSASNGGQWSVSVLDFARAYACFRFLDLGFWISDYAKSHNLLYHPYFHTRRSGWFNSGRNVQSDPALKFLFLCQSFFPCAGKTSWSLWRSAGGVLPCFGWSLESEKLQLDRKRKTGTAGCDLWLPLFVQARKASGWVADVCFLLGFGSLMNLPWKTTSLIHGFVAQGVSKAVAVSTTRHLAWSVTNRWRCRMKDRAQWAQMMHLPGELLSPTLSAFLVATSKPDLKNGSSNYTCPPGKSWICFYILQEDNSCWRHWTFGPRQFTEAVATKMD